MEATSPLGRPLYSYGQVDRILGVRPGTARRWINGYNRLGTAYEPVVRLHRLDDRNLVTWGEFVETYYLARLRSHPVPVPMHRIRRALQRLRDRLGVPYAFADERVLHAEREGLLDVVKVIQEEEGVDDFLVEVLSNGQLMLLPEARRRLERIEFDGGIAARLRPRLDIDTIFVSGHENFGRPMIGDTFITPSAVAELVQAGDPLDMVAQLYELPPRLINDAGLFTYGDRWRLLVA